MDSDLIHVDAYVKSDGTQVSDYWRRRGTVAEDNYLKKSIGRLGGKTRPWSWQDNKIQDEPGEIFNKLPKPAADLIQEVIPSPVLEENPSNKDSNSMPKKAKDEVANGTANFVLSGGISVNIFPLGAILGFLGATVAVVVGVAVIAATIAIKVAQKVAKIKQKIDKLIPKNSSKQDIERYHRELEEATLELDKAQEAIGTERDNTLQKLVKTKNQDEYKKIYTKYMLQRDLYRKNEDVLRGVKAGVHNKDYDMVTAEVSNYENNLSDFVQKSAKIEGIEIPTIDSNNSESIEMNSKMPKLLSSDNINNVNEQSIKDELQPQSPIMKSVSETVFRDTVDIHAKAREYLYLADLADGYARQGKLAVGQVTPNGWTVRDVVYDKTTNFKSVVYEKGDEVVIDYAGTDFLNIKDNLANLKAFFTGNNKQIDQAIKHCSDVKKAYPYKKITVIEHSEGGTETIHAGLKNNLNVITYGALGVGKMPIPDNYTGTIVNYITPNDIVPKLKPNIGTNYVVEPNQYWVQRYTPLGIPYAHRLLAGYNGLRNPILIEDYLRRYLPARYQNTVFTPAERDRLIEIWRQEGLKNMQDVE